MNEFAGSGLVFAKEPTVTAEFQIVDVKGVRIRDVRFEIYVRAG